MRRKVFFAGVVFLLAFAGWLVLFPPQPRQVQAQGGGTGQSFTLKFTIPASASINYILPCSATLTSGCIPNYKQVGQTINYSFATNPGLHLLRNCGILLDGSNDNVNFETFAASGNPFGQQNGSFSANGYYPYYRIKALPCAVSALSIIYVGYGTQIPISPLSYAGISPFQVSPISVAASTQADPQWVTPAILTGFQCFNPGGSAAFLQLYVAASAPTMGVGMVYGLEIPAGQTVSYGGPPLSYYALTNGATVNKLFAAAATAEGTGQAVTFNATPTAGGINYVQADVGANLVLTSCGAYVAIIQVNGGAGTGPVTQISTTPAGAGGSCMVGTGKATTGGTGTGATLEITATAGSTAVSTPIWCNFQTNGTGPYYPFNPVSP
jgi:hypothetical protein